MDRGYVDYRWWKRMTEGCVYFVTRFKPDLRYEVTAEREVPKNSTVRKGIDIRITPYRQDIELNLRLVTVWISTKKKS